MDGRQRNAHGERILEMEMRRAHAKDRGADDAEGKLGRRRAEGIVRQAAHTISGVGVKRATNYILFFTTQPSRGDDQRLDVIKEYGKTFCPEDVPVGSKISHVCILARVGNNHCVARQLTGLSVAYLLPAFETIELHRVGR